MKLKNQKKWVFVPYANIIIIFISICKNAGTFKGLWQFKLVACVFAGVLPIFIISRVLFEFGISNGILYFIWFYASSIVASIIMIYWQKKNGVE